MATTWRSPSRSASSWRWPSASNIVVGLAGLLDLGYVAFFAVEHYAWASSGRPRPNQISAEPSSPVRQLVLRVLLVGVAGRPSPASAIGLPVRRLHGRLPGHRNPRLRRGSSGPRQQPRQAHQHHQRPKGITAISRPPLFFEPGPRAMGIEPNPASRLPAYLYFLSPPDRRGHRAGEPVSRTPKSAGPGKRPRGPDGGPGHGSPLVAGSSGLRVRRVVRGGVGRPLAAKQVFINRSPSFMESIGVLAMVIWAGWGPFPGPSWAPPWSLS